MDITAFLTVVHFLFYLRYPGPFLAGVGLFFNIMLILYILWLTDFKVKQNYKRKPKFDIYEKAIQKWKHQQQQQASKLKFQEKAANKSESNFIEKSSDPLHSFCSLRQSKESRVMSGIECTSC